LPLNTPTHEENYLNKKLEVKNMKNLTAQLTPYTRVVKELTKSYGLNISYIENLLLTQLRAYGLSIETVTYGKIMEIWDRDCALILDEQMNEYGLAA
jgi:energy-converting hydrogenase Eha subunit F